MAGMTVKNRREPKSMNSTAPSSPLKNGAACSSKNDIDAVVNSTSEVSSKNQIVKGAFCVLGIYGFFIVFGYCQENLFKLQDSVTGAKFTFSNSLIFTLCLSNTIITYLSLVASSYFFNKVNTKKGDAATNLFQLWKLDQTSFLLLLVASLTYVGSMSCTNYALTHVNFPTQVLVKSAKMVLVIAGGFFVFGKRYPLYDYVAVTLVSAALVVFNMSSASSKEHATQTFYGILLLVFALLCDGMTGPFQDKITSRVPNITPVQLMFYMNILGVVWSFAAAITLEGLKPFVFLANTPIGWYWVFLFCISGTLGQFFIFLSLTTFGSLYTSLFTTLRKATSTVVSVYAFDHRMTFAQWNCVTIIFGTLILQSYFSHRHKARAKLQNKPKNT